MYMCANSATLVSNAYVVIADISVHALSVPGQAACATYGTAPGLSTFQPN